MDRAQSLSADELVAFVERVFRPRPVDRTLAILVDLPDQVVGDTPAWQLRRALAADWAQQLRRTTDAFSTALFAYRNVRTNNGELPAEAWPLDPGAPLPADAAQLAPSAAVALEQVLRSHRLVVALTQFSATAPLKLAAPRLRFRAATMPGFGVSMIPALRLDYGKVNRRVLLLKELLDEAQSAELAFEHAETRARFELRLDLRHRRAHASGGLVATPGVAGNVPSGESYIVPYEGERAGDPSRSAGVLPVQLEDEVVRYRIAENRATAVEGDGPRAAGERDLLAREPAYGNIAELGLGVLADFGVAPVGEILLDEKLGLHLAFGRSDHFGGQVGPGDFSRPGAVVHIDRVYRPSMQPLLRVARADLAFADGRRLPLIRDDAYAVAW